MLSLRELRRAAQILEKKLKGAPLRRAIEPDNQKLVLVFDHPEGKSHVMIASRPEYGRICLTGPVETATAPSSFYEYVRAHLPGTSLSGIESAVENRQIELQLQRGSERFQLILSILGARSNIYMLDGDRKILHSMRPLEETRRELKIGELWTNPRGTAPDDATDRWADLPDEEYLQAIGATYDELERRNEAERLVRRIEQAVKKERAFLERKSVNLQEDLGEAKKAETYKHIGELLKSVLHTISLGDSLVHATDYCTGQTVSIPLDPKLSPAANLESYFARYQKESRGVTMIEQQIHDLQAAQAELDSIMYRLEEAARGEMPDITAIQAIASLPKIHRLMQRQSPRRKTIPVSAKTAGKKEIPTRLLPKRYRTQDGMEVWVGRSDEGNDYLTTRLARGNDLFFHLEGYPGSHVVLRTEGRPDPPPKSLLEACELAVHFSKLKSSGSADVHMAHIKDVKKPRGAKPGLVYVRSGKTIRLKRDPKRLQSILASRLDQ